MTATAAQIKKEAIPVNKCPICTATIPPNAPVCEMCGEHAKGEHAMTEQELLEIERLAIDQDRLFDPSVVIDLIAEVRRLNRMVDAAVYCLTEVPCGHCVFEEWCSPSPGGPSCEQTLRKHLESEADNNG